MISTCIRLRAFDPLLECSQYLSLGLGVGECSKNIPIRDYAVLSPMAPKKVAVPGAGAERGEHF
jgi:hypothetical protein